MDKKMFAMYEKRDKVLLMWTENDLLINVVTTN